MLGDVDKRRISGCRLRTLEVLRRRCREGRNGGTVSLSVSGEPRLLSSSCRHCGTPHFNSLTPSTHKVRRGEKGEMFANLNHHILPSCLPR
jgi:hypothetical protein